MRFAGRLPGVKPRTSITPSSRCPAPRRNAICAIYAFMRRADDLADDESFSIAERRIHLDAWLAAWRAVCAGEPAADPVFLAVRDATTRFAIPLSLLDELVAGVTMDSTAPTQHAERARHLRHLRRSLPLLLSGGLGRGPGLHSHLRLLRSARRKTCRGNRHRLPAHQHSPRRSRGRCAQSRLSSACGPCGPPCFTRRVASSRLGHAAHSRASARCSWPSPCAPKTTTVRPRRCCRSLTPKAGLPCRCWSPSIMRLLKRIEQADYDVFSRRASVPLREKLAILAVGLTRMTWARLVT